MCNMINLKMNSEITIQKLILLSKQTTVNCVLNLVASFYVFVLFSAEKGEALISTQIFYKWHFEFSFHNFN